MERLGRIHVEGGEGGDWDCKWTRRVGNGPVGIVGGEGLVAKRLPWKGLCISDTRSEQDFERHGGRGVVVTNV